MACQCNYDIQKVICCGPSERGVECSSTVIRHHHSHHVTPLKSTHTYDTRARLESNTVCWFEVPFILATAAMGLLIPVTCCPGSLQDCCPTTSWCQGPMTTAPSNRLANPSAPDVLSVPEPHLRLMAFRLRACHTGCTALGALRARLMCACMAAMGSRCCLSAALVLRPTSRRQSSASGGVCVSACRTEFMKQVLPRFTSPEPCTHDNKLSLNCALIQPVALTGCSTSVHPH